MELMGLIKLMGFIWININMGLIWIHHQSMASRESQDRVMMIMMSGRVWLDELRL